MKKIFYILAFITLFSCEYLEIQKKDTSKNQKPIASVYDSKLYKKDIQNLLPKNIASQDSLLLVKNIINSWAKKQLLLKQAQLNASEENNKNITDLVEKYKQSLFINEYKERLVNQQLDTIISDAEVLKYYQENKNNFKLNEELLVYKYIHFGNDFLDKKEVIKKFKSSKEEDLESLENQIINFKSSRLRDSTWVTIDNVLLKIPAFKKEPKENLLKISKYLKKEDSLGVYLVAVNKVLKRNQVAPLSYIDPQIKQLILHKRKLQLIRDIEKTLINDAIQNKHFKEY